MRTEKADLFGVTLEYLLSGPQCADPFQLVKLK